MAKQEEIRSWWSENPMVYDWRGEIAERPDAPAYLAEVERRFLRECWFAQDEGAPPFSGLIDFDWVAGKDVLEIGCGSGVHAKLLAQAGARLTAVDLTPTAVALTKRRLELHGLDADVREADAEALPFADGSFDFVWSWGVVHHSSRTEQVLAEIARVLRPGGRVALMVYHRGSITYWVNYMLIRGVLMGGLLRERPAELANRWSDGVVARHFSGRELRDLLARDFTDVGTRVMGQIGEAVPLPARIRGRVEGLVPLQLRRAILQRAGWFVVVTGERR